MTGFKVSFDVIFQCRFLIQFQPVGRWPLAETLIWASYWVSEPNVGLFGVWWPCHIDLATSRVNINHPKGEKAQFSPSSAQQWLFLAENDHLAYIEVSLSSCSDVGRPESREVTSGPYSTISAHIGAPRRIEMAKTLPSALFNPPLVPLKIPRHVWQWNHPNGQRFVKTQFFGQVFLNG